MEPGSPADDAGLKEGDHIVEVNGASVEESSHAQVVTRIKAQPNTVNLLVADPECEKYYKRKSIMVKSDMLNIKRIEARNKLAESEPVHEEIEIDEATMVAAAVHVEPHVMKGKTENNNNYLNVEMYPTNNQAFDQIYTPKISKFKTIKRVIMLFSRNLPTRCQMTSLWAFISWPCWYGP